MTAEIEMRSEKIFDPETLARLETRKMRSQSFQEYSDTQALLLIAEFDIPFNVAFSMAGFAASLRELDREKDKTQRTRILTSYHQLLSVYSNLNYDYKTVGKLNSEIPSLHEKEAWVDNLSRMVSLIYSVPIETLRNSSELSYEASNLHVQNLDDVSDEKFALIKSKLNQSYELLLQAIQKQAKID